MTWLSATDSSLTTTRIIPILRELKEWNGFGSFKCAGATLVPSGRADLIRANHTSVQDQKEKAALYYATYTPHASWGNLAAGLYLSGEERATEAFRVQLPKKTGNQCVCVESVG